MVIESLLVISMTAFYLTIVPRCRRADRLVRNVKPVAKNIQWVDAFCLCCMGKLPTIVCLDHIRSVSKVDDRPLHEIDSTVTAILLISVDESLPSSFF